MLSVLPTTGISNLSVKSLIIQDPGGYIHSDVIFREKLRKRDRWTYSR